MDADIAALIASLSKARTFEDAAEKAVFSLVRLATEALSQSPYARRGKILRGMVHLRPGDGYRRLVVVQSPEAGAHRAATADPPCVPSATAWRWVSTHERAVAVDVALGMFDLDTSRSSTALDTRDGARFDSQESQARLLDREATHVFVLPLRSPGGSVDGMISIEAECRAAMGRAFIWGDVREEAQALADIAAPFLVALPAKHVDAAAPDEFLPVIGDSMAGLIEVLRVFARQEETILVSGPTGAGKSRLARWCHEQSRRRAQPFETLELASVGPELQMARLYGWKKGAFTGAHKDTTGSIARAQGGTLFIDEIDKLSLGAQAGLLRVLEERRFSPLGDDRGDTHADVRFIVGTNVDLYGAVRAGQFREDLYFRINVLPVKVPPLDERADEIPRWARYMLDRRHREGHEGRGEGTVLLSPDAERALVASRWPGNLRQLDNIVRRAYALSLIGGGASAGALVLEGHHVEQALRYEGGTEQRSLLDLLHIAGAAFVAEAERQRSAGASLDLDLAGAFEGFVLDAAVRRHKNVEAALRVLGKESVVQNRNHHKTVRRALEKVDQLHRALGREPFVSSCADVGVEPR
jgi:DNA-binding NtrC family response regulator